MRLASCSFGAKDEACILTEFGVVSIETLNKIAGKEWPTDLYRIVADGKLEEIKDGYAGLGLSRQLLHSLSYPLEEAMFGPLYKTPRKIWGIGFNYVEHPVELSNRPADEEPVGFMKPDTALIGQRDVIQIPQQSRRTTAEAELAIIIGKPCRNVSMEEAKHCIAGFTTSLDITADDIHKRNPRFLTRAKSFDTFFSFGPVLVTPDEIVDINQVEVQTVINGEVKHRNRISNMRYHPYHIVSFHSAVMTLLPGDIIMTGTPGAAEIQDGDTAECRIAGFVPLTNPVVDMKVR